MTPKQLREEKITIALYSLVCVCWFVSAIALFPSWGSALFSLNFVLVATCICLKISRIRRSSP